MLLDLLRASRACIVAFAAASASCLLLACGSDASGPSTNADTGDGASAPVMDSGTTEVGAPDAVATGPDGGGSPAPLTECSSPKPEWVFCSGFEEGSFKIWDDYDGNPPTEVNLVADPGPWNVSGNHVGHLFVQPGRGDSDLVKVLPPHDRLYARWYIEYEPGFDFTAPNHGSALYGGDRNLLGVSGIRPTGTDRFQLGPQYENTNPPVTGTYNYYAGMYQDCADPNGACWGDSLPCVYDQGKTYCTRPADRPTAKNEPPAVVAGRWYCVETMVDGGTPTPSAAGADGRFDWWVDGQEMGPFTLWLRSTPALQVNLLWLQLFFHTTHGAPGVFYDDVVVSTEPIGCR
jgi:hypothetical protein